MRAAVLAVLSALTVLAGPAGPATAGEAVAAAGSRWTWPVAGPVVVTRPFVPPAHRYGVGHRGADLLARPGTAVRAAGAGRVAYAGLVAGRGVVVVVHGPLRTTYEPVTAVVALGAAVAAGDVIARLEAGHDGCPASACLHWGLRRGEDHLDPVRLVRRGPVRLLPVGPVGSARAGPGSGGATGLPMTTWPGGGSPEALAGARAAPGGTAAAARSPSSAAVRQAAGDGSAPPGRSPTADGLAALAGGATAALTAAALAGLTGAAARTAAGRRRPSRQT